ncbi:unnamed protein product [Phytophthora fragariaefolia]|uniref:Unnamed protein product n=1 Tax=Phytophthora fragariaefolia TaxID=1490495 RepID=A0A9W7CZC8_9STRA|nr:unnamed protein product [Phytophthora fragariaefolia]
MRQGGAPTSGMPETNARRNSQAGPYSGSQRRACQAGGGVDSRQWASRHLTKNASWLDDVEDREDECVQPDGNALKVTKRGTLMLRVTAGGETRTVKLTNVYYAENVLHSLISYGQLDQKRYSLMRKDGQRVVATHDGKTRLRCGTSQRGTGGARHGRAQAGETREGHYGGIEQRE